MPTERTRGARYRLVSALCCLVEALSFRLRCAKATVSTQPICSRRSILQDLRFLARAYLKFEQPCRGIQR